MFGKKLLNGWISRSRKSTQTDKPLHTIEDAKAFIENNFKHDKETLVLAEELLDPEGMHMAVLGVHLLKAGYFPDGQIQKKGYHIFQYRKG
jgi:hypothetical protein